MGMSYELADAHVADMRAQIWTLTRATFTGAAILLREKAAYRSTSFRLCRGAGVGDEAVGAGGLKAAGAWVRLAKTKYRGLATSQRTMRLSAASVEMTCVL